MHLKHRPCRVIRVGRVFVRMESVDQFADVFVCMWQQPEGGGDDKQTSHSPFSMPLLLSISVASVQQSSRMIFDNLGHGRRRLVIPGGILFR